MSDTHGEPVERPPVLIVEDREPTLDVRMEGLAMAGCEPWGATNAGEAVAFLLGAKQPVSMILADVNLDAGDAHDKSGIAVARFARQAGLDVPIVGYSAIFGGRGDLREDEFDEFDAYQAKGSRGPEELTEALAEYGREARQTPPTRLPVGAEHLVPALDRFIGQMATASEVARGPKSTMEFVQGWLYNPTEGPPIPYDPRHIRPPVRPKPGSGS